MSDETAPGPVAAPPVEGRVGARRMLVAFDASPAAKLALQLAADVAAGIGAEVGIVSVAPDRPGPPADDPWSERSEHAAELRKAQQMLARRGLAATLHEPTGDAGPMIVQVAREFGYDIIVVGSRRLDPLRRALLGSVSTYLVRHADASVLIAR